MSISSPSFSTPKRPSLMRTYAPARPSLVRRSGVVPLESLCIAPGRAAWVLYVDATCINYDGNAFDATLLAMVAALKHSEPPSLPF